MIVTNAIHLKIHLIGLESRGKEWLSIEYWTYVQDHDTLDQGILRK